MELRFQTEVNPKSKVMLKFGLKLGVKPNSSAKNRVQNRT